MPGRRPHHHHHTEENTTTMNDPGSPCEHNNHALCVEPECPCVCPDHTGEAEQ